MHDCVPYGELRVNGAPMSVAQLARLVGIDVAECQQAVDELEAAGVPSRTVDGAIYSRRMVRDELLRAARAKGGMAGAEHGIKGAKHGSKGGRPMASTGVMTGVSYPPLKPPPSSSSSSKKKDSESPEKPETLSEPSPRFILSSDSNKSDPSVPVEKPVKAKARIAYSTAFEAFWRDYPTDKLMSKKLAFTRWQALGDDDQHAAHAACSAFKAYCRANPTYRPVHAERFISQRRFDGFAVVNGSGFFDPDLTKLQDAQDAARRARQQDKPA